MLIKKSKIMFTELKDDTLEKEVKNNDKVVVQYAASWCGNCRLMKPKFKKLAKENEDVSFILIDAERTLNPESWPRSITYRPLQHLRTASSLIRYRPINLNH